MTLFYSRTKLLTCERLSRIPKQIDNDDRIDDEPVRRFVTQLVKVRARHVVDLFHKLRTDRERNLAQRTIYNIYTVVAACSETRSSPT
jgi:hypothetical protein